MWLTDSQQKRLLSEIYSTTSKIEAVLRKHKLDTVPAAILAEIEKLRKQQGEIHENTKDLPWLSKFLANGMKFFGSQAEQKYPSSKKK